LLLVGIVIAISSIAGGFRGARKPKEAFESGDYLLENEKFKL
jgi:hypothetical protein